MAKRGKDRDGYKCEQCYRYDHVWTMYYHFQWFQKMLCWVCFHKKLNESGKASDDAHIQLTSNDDEGK